MYISQNCLKSNFFINVVKNINYIQILSLDNIKIFAKEIKIEILSFFKKILA